MAKRITDRMVRALAPPASKYKVINDDELPGFGIRVTRTGVKSFVFSYAGGGRERRYTIGRYPAWSVAAAREEAGRLRVQVDIGRDPMGDRHAKRSAPTIDDLCEAYLSDYVPGRNRASTITHYKDVIERFIRPELGKLKVSAVRHGDVEALHKFVTEHGPYIANQTAAVLSKMMNVAIKWGWRTDNPVKGIERNQESKRDRYLSGPELRRLSKALADYPVKEKVRLGREDALKLGRKSGWKDRETPNREREQSCNAIRLLMLTGARKSEVLAATWDQFDLSKGVWRKPGATTKQTTVHRVPLSAPALELLAALRAESEFVFPGRHGGHQKDLKKAWASIRVLADIEDVRIHDLRHTYAAQLASAGLSLPIIGALLGHTQPATTARYAHLMDDPLREATERVGEQYISASKATNDNTAENASNE